MNRLQSKTLLVGLSLLFFLQFPIRGAAAVNEKKVDTQSVNINIGIYAPFSDKRAFIGRNILGAMEMAYNESHASNIHYAFFPLNKESDADPTALLQKFIAVHHLDILVTEGSTNGTRVASVAKQNGLLHFSMASDASIADGKNNFLIWSPASEQAAVLVNTLQQKKIARLGIISSTHPSDMVLTQSVIKRVEANPSIHVESLEFYDQGTRDFMALLSKIKGKNPDLYVIMAPPKDIELIQAGMKSNHIDKPITTIVEHVTPKVMKLFNDQWYVDTQDMKPEFITHYLEENRNYPVTEAGYAYDLFKIINHSVQTIVANNHRVTPENIAHFMSATPVESGVMGAGNFDKNGVLYTKSEVKMVHEGSIRTA